jgi:hypothetical protein
MGLKDSVAEYCYEKHMNILNVGQKMLGMQYHTVQSRLKDSPWQFQALKESLWLLSGSLRPRCDQFRFAAIQQQRSPASSDAVKRTGNRLLLDFPSTALHRCAHPDSIILPNCVGYSPQIIPHSERPAIINH